MQNSAVLELTQSNFAALIERSQSVPVLIDFWADWCQPCKQIAPVLEKLAAELQGKLVIAKLNVDQEQDLAAQFGVRSLPTLKLVYQGRLVDEKAGALSEAQLRQWLAPVLGDGGNQEADIEAFLAQIREAIGQGQQEEALAALTEFVQQFPEQVPARLLLAELLLDQGDVERAQTLLTDIDDALAAPLKARLALLLAAGDAPVEDLEHLPPQEKIAAARRVAAQGNWEQGLEALLSVMRDHRDQHGTDAKAAMLELFDAMPKGDPLTSLYRRKLFNLLH